MGIVKRLTQIISSGFALAATPEAQPWKTPHRAPLAPDQSATSVPPPPQLPEQRKANSDAPPPVALTRRELVVFASGFALAASATVGVWMLYESDLWPVRGAARTSVATTQPGAQASGQLTTCPMEPVAAAASEKDGLFPLQSSVEGLIAADITSFMVIGNQAVAAGRTRDAEAAFLMSCRVAEKLKGAASVESAEAKYQLGSLYERLAINGSAAGGADRAELLGRAERLYQDSMQAAVAQYGKTHEKSRLAAQGLEAVRQTLAQGENLQPTPAPAPVPVPAPVPALPSTAAAPPARPLSATGAETRSRQDPSVLKKCPEAVATLGLCNP